MIEKAKFIVMQSFRAGSDSKVLIIFTQHKVNKKNRNGQPVPEKDE